MMGVHGNGLTSLVWMKPTPRSTVMEFFYPGGFAHDYEYTTRALGMVHYGFWGSKYVVLFLVAELFSWLVLDILLVLMCLIRPTQTAFKEQEYPLMEKQLHDFVYIDSHSRLRLTIRCAAVASLFGSKGWAPGTAYKQHSLVRPPVADYIHSYP